jgi:hypothetical protein
VPLDQGKGSKLVFSLNCLEICYPAIEFQQLFDVNLRCIVPSEFVRVDESIPLLNS